ncbi:MarR family winged helix-turn-helix transcriptional regulator [Cohnella hashimotonis]|uniref:MarR family winged helix-turn-helix transcriptional regulator n=1 Tax=Cohnella hashimotonis TaxID=2826895 RepID=A0ABT6TSH0_9BACL|nr:MarR family winged helix-turn-helix transcriptional regulator [Cohnella hashimotonis]MDI4649802.1 MarR family winged helix-turn-helix transcriptional regulator [Cohnella hashimotonis]
MDLSDDAIGYLLSRAYFLHKKKATHLLEGFGITPEQYGILHQLNKQEGITQKALAELHGKDQTSIGKTLERLENKKLVIRKTDQVDRRAILLYLSSEGKALYGKTLPVMQGLNGDLVNLITPEGNDQLTALLRKLNQALNS